MYEVEKGCNTILLCFSYQNVIWTPPATSPAGVYVTQFGEYTIKNVQFHHTGMYHCQGTGENESSAQTELQVLGVMSKSIFSIPVPLFVMLVKARK